MLVSVTFYVGMRDVWMLRWALGKRILREEERVNSVALSSTMLRLRLRAGVLKVVVDSGRSATTTSLDVGGGYVYLLFCCGCLFFGVAGLTRHWGYVGAVVSAVLFGMGATLNKLVLADVHPSCRTPCS
jgi:hypothetical protein